MIPLPQSFILTFRRGPGRAAPNAVQNPLPGTWLVRSVSGNVSRRDMDKRKFRVGDKVKVIRYSPCTYAPGVEDTMGTEKLFRSIVGSIYTIRGFDEHGYVELQPTRKDTIWIGPEILKLRARKAKKPR
jgi:hypothetical protein